MRRHSHRKLTGGSQLSQDGVDLARRVGAATGPFAVVATSVVPRARETAIAMGFAVDLELVTLSGDPAMYDDAASTEWWTAPAPFAALAAALEADGPFRDHAHAMAALWRDLLTPLGPDDTALFVGHSGDLEAALVCCFPAADHAAWGSLFGPCEGARLAYDGALPCWRSVELLRAPAA